MTTKIPVPTEIELEVRCWECGTTLNSTIKLNGDFVVEPCQECINQMICDRMACRDCGYGEDTP
jgi:hypothetical protein